MIATKSASKSQKTASSSQQSGANGTPFDQIVAMEEQEKKRMQKEVDAMHKIEEETRQSCAKKEAETEQELKEKAKAELKKYKEEDLSPLLRAAEADAAKSCKKIEETYDQTSDALATELAKKLIDPTSHLIA